MPLAAAGACAGGAGLARWQSDTGPLLQAETAYEVARGAEVGAQLTSLLADWQPEHTEVQLFAAARLW